MRKTPNWTSSEKNDVLFYVLYGVVSKLLGKTDIKPNDNVDLDIELATEEFINTIKKQIYARYKELGGDGRIAKSQHFVSHIDKLLGFS